MKNKFFILGITSLAAALMMVSGAFADSSTASVTVAADTTLTLSLGSKITSMTFTVSSYVVNDSHSKQWYAGTPVTAYAINVVDYTGAAESGKSGHYISMKIDRSRWYYNGNDTDKATRLRYSTLNSDNSNAVTSNQIRIAFGGTMGTHTFTAKDTDLCSSGSNFNLYGNFLYTTNQLIARTTATCPGTHKYYHMGSTLTGPSNGLGNGSYTISGTITLTDGQ